MTGIHDYMSKHHELCDDIFARAREAVTDDDWEVAERDCNAFLREINRHIDVEENLLFPAFEEHSGMAGGPTHVMRLEHAEMRDHFAEMLAAIAAKENEEYLRAAELVMAILSKHNMKEENILYPMLDNLLGSDGAGMLAQVKTAME